MDFNFYTYSLPKDGVKCLQTHKIDCADKRVFIDPVTWFTSTSYVVHPTETGSETPIVCVCVIHA